LLAAIVGLNWLAATRVATQHAAYLESTAALQAFDRMRTATHRIVSSANEFALIAMTTGGAVPFVDNGNAEQPVETGNTAEPGETDEEDSPAEAMAKERELISTAVQDFDESLSNLKSSAHSPSQGVAAIETAFGDLKDVNAELFDAIAASRTDTSRVFEIKEEQERAEENLIETIHVQQEQVQQDTKARSDALVADFGNMKRYSLAGGLLAALILLASTAHIGRRITSMFDENTSHRVSIEKANGDLNAAMQTLQQVQGELVAAPRPRCTAIGVHHRAGLPDKAR
jgi:type II secretory pathway pseudopilin PulG